MTPCKVAIRLEEFCKTFFELERSSKRWRVLETSFTDVVIASFRASGSARVNVDASIEAVTGADVEILFSPIVGLPYVLVIQSKRAVPSSPKNLNWSYRELFHKPPKKPKFQVEQIIDYCAAPRKFPHIPLYAFYHSESAAIAIGTTGITCLDAVHVHTELMLKKKNNRGTKLCSKYAPDTFPFHHLFCDDPFRNPTHIIANRLGQDWGNDAFFRQAYADKWPYFDGTWGESPAANTRILIEI